MNTQTLFNLLIIITVGVFSSSLPAENTSKHNAATELLSQFSLSDIAQIYENCGNADSRADTCAHMTNKVIETRFKHVKPITSTDVNVVWEHCYDKGDDKLCANNINSILKLHMPATTHYSVSEEDIRQIKSLNFMESQEGYASILTKVDALLS